MSELESHLGHNLPGGLLVLAPNGAILEAPSFFRRALLLDERPVPSIFHLFDEEDPPYLVLHRIFRHSDGSTEYHLRVQGLFRAHQGFRYWSVATPAEFEESAGGTFFLVDDSSLIRTQDWEIRRLRREILADAQDSLSSHFKNRLATVQLLAETIRDAPEIAKESAPRLLKAVEELTSALNRVMTGIADISTPTDYEDSPIRLSDLALVVPTWARRDQTVKCVMQNVTPTALIPASSIERILLPLVENALEASPAGSTIEVAISEMDEGFAHFDIIDEGEGMSEQVIARSADPFFTTRAGHLGLGLAHARQALREAGGEWHIESKPHLGTRITLLLPITTAEQLYR